MIGIKSVIYERNNERLVISIDEKESKIENSYISKTIDNKIVLDYLTCLYRIINDWQKEYIDINMIDGGSWKLSIIYDSGTKREYRGKASYPINFEAFERLNKKLFDEVANG